MLTSKATLTYSLSRHASINRTENPKFSTNPSTLKKLWKFCFRIFFSIKQTYFRSQRDPLSLISKVIPSCRIHSCRHFYLFFHNHAFVSYVSFINMYFFLSFVYIIMFIICLLHAFPFKKIHMINLGFNVLIKHA